MDRFDQSMSWNSPTEAEQFELQRGSGDQLATSSLWSSCASARSFFLPVHYTPTYAYPLIVWFHNNGHNEHQIDSVMPHISLRNHVGVGIRAPRAADTKGHRFDWHDSRSSVFAAHDATCEAVDEAMHRFSIHPSRVVLAGYREGGTMAQRVALREPERFAGVISLGGRLPQQGAMGNLSQLRPRRLPMLWQWGRDNPEFTDENLKADCRLTMSIGADLEIRQYPDDDEMNTVVLADVDDWIMRRIVAASSISSSDRWATSPIAYSRN